MHVLIHALSCTNLSGRQVLCGHLLEMLRHAAPRHRFTLLLHVGNREVVTQIEEEWGGTVSDVLGVRFAPRTTVAWPGRLVYDWTRLPRLIREERVDTLLTLSGGYVRGLPCRQYTLALNPQPFIPAAQPDALVRAKSTLQRYAGTRAVRHADGIGYASSYMRDLYRRAAGRMEQRSAIVYAALGAREIEEMERLRTRNVTRDPMGIVCVSRMARLKNIETLVRAVSLLHTRYACLARLRLVGGWSDESYRKEIVAVIRGLGLEAYVEITGHVPREELIRACAAARVYALLSRSESFGIPSIEAQWMATPVVAARGCAAPEVCGAGGRYVDPEDADGAANHLARLMQDDAYWRKVSAQAEANARRFTYARTSLALMDLLEL